MRSKNHASPLKGIPKTKLQASRASNPKTLQSKTRPFAEKRLSINGLSVVHGRRVKLASNAKTEQSKQRFGCCDPGSGSAENPAVVAQHLNKFIVTGRPGN